MKFIINISLFIIILFFFSGCGRRQKNIFHFSDETVSKIKINKLDLNFVRNINIEKISDGILLTWDFIDQTIDKDFKSSLKKEIIGYNVYKLVNALIIPKKPLNKKYITTNFYLDKLDDKNNKKIESCFYYVIRGVFRIDKQIEEGPTSQIIFIDTDKNNIQDK